MKTFSGKKKVLLAWELGEHLGHWYNFKFIADELYKKNYDVLIAGKELHHAEKVFGDNNHAYVQAPVWLPRNRKAIFTACMPDILFRRGYDHPDGLISLIKAWYRLFKLYQPDMIVVDYAPTALLASRLFPCKVMITGNGFGELEAGSQLKALIPGDHTAHLKDTEHRLKTSVNTAAKKLNFEPIAQVSDIWRCNKTLIRNIPELDPHGDTRKNAVYLGPLKAPKQSTILPEWKTNYQRAFLYLKRSNKIAPRILTALARAPLETAVYIDNLPRDITDKLPSHIHCFNSPLSQDILQQVDITLCDGGGTMLHSLLAGTPLLAAPMQMEQRYIAEQCTASGWGNALKGNESAENIYNVLREALHSHSHKANVQSLKQRYVNLYSEAGTQLFVQEMEKLL